MLGTCGPGVSGASEPHAATGPTEIPAATGRKGIYWDRDNFQSEYLLMDASTRCRYLPPEAVRMCGQMSELGRLVLRDILRRAGIATGRLR